MTKIASVLFLMAMSMNTFAQDIVAFEKCNELTNKLSAESLIAVSEQKVFSEARDLYLQDKTEEKKKKMYEALSGVHKVVTQVNDLCIENFSQNK